MEQTLLDLVRHFGYLIVLLGVGIESMGVPVPGETTLLAGAVLAAQGHLSPAGVALAGWAGAVAGDNLGYGIGRRWGRRLVTVRGIRRVWDPRRVAVAEDFFDRHGIHAVFLGRFVALLRIFAGPLAGMHRMPWPRFLVANAAGGAVWVGAVVAAGLLLGGNLGRVSQLVSRAGYVALAAVVVLAVLWVGFAWRRRRLEEARGAVLLAMERGPSDEEEIEAETRGR